MFKNIYRDNSLENLINVFYETPLKTSKTIKSREYAHQANSPQTGLSTLNLQTRVINSF